MTEHTHTSSLESFTYIRLVCLHSSAVITAAAHSKDVNAWCTTFEAAIHLPDLGDNEYRSTLPTLAMWC